MLGIVIGLLLVKLAFQNRDFDLQRRSLQDAAPIIACLNS
jgi:hypothetical protein